MGTRVLWVLWGGGGLTCEFRVVFEEFILSSVDGERGRPRAEALLVVG
jgi:hypothetical protein